MHSVEKARRAEVSFMSLIRLANLSFLSYNLYWPPLSGSVLKQLAPVALFGFMLEFKIDLPKAASRVSWMIMEGLNSLECKQLADPASDPHHYSAPQLLSLAFGMEEKPNCWFIYTPCNLRTEDTNSLDFKKADTSCINRLGLNVLPL